MDENKVWELAQSVGENYRKPEAHLEAAEQLKAVNAGGREAR